MCAGDTCQQRFPLLPDDGQWECADIDGVVVCRMGTEPAGVVPGPPAQGWVCNQRQRQDAAPGDRICVLLQAEMPQGAARGWRCHYLHDPERRSCRRDANAPKVGAECSAAQGCVDGTSCREGRCRPEPPRPGCWLDPDCADGERCIFGSCRT